MISKLNHVSGPDYAPGIYKDFNISSLALRRGALVQKGVGTNTIALFTQATAVGTLPIMGLTNGPRLTTDTQANVELMASGELCEFDVTEIINQTVITATGGSATTFVCSTLQGMSNSCLIGAVVKVLSMASGNQSPGTLLTATGYTNSSGTLTFASLGATGFASGDTIQIMSLNNDYVFGETGCVLNTTYMDSIDLLSTRVTSANVSFVRIIGTNQDQGSNTTNGTFNGSRLQGVLLTGIDTVMMTGVTGI